MSKVVSEKVCFITGHNIQGIVKEEAYDPNAKIMASERIVICIKCGKSHADILLEKLPITRKKKTEGSLEADSALDKI